MKKNVIKAISIFVIMAFFSGCSQHSNRISGNYVSPGQYQNYSCDQIQIELNRVRSQVSILSGQQDKEATKDAFAFGIGMLLFWPALFFMIGDDKKDELQRLKGEYNALSSMSNQKKCGY